MLTKAKARIAAGAAFLLIALNLSRAQASWINFDFGSATDTPSASYGGAASQAGIWNGISGNKSSGILDVSGLATNVSITFSGLISNNVTANLAAGDANTLMEDYFYTQPTGAPTSGPGWTMNLSGLDDGIYNVYLYKPAQNGRGIGTGTLNGVGFSSTNTAVFSGTLVQNTNYLLMTSVSVIAGTLSAHGGASNFYTGLSGMQLVQVSGPSGSAVPGPAAILLLATGMAGLGLSRRRKVA
jgi:hypothetical protein